MADLLKVAATSSLFVACHRGDDDDDDDDDDITRSLEALRAPTSSWRSFSFRPLDFVLRALRALRQCHPFVSDWIVC